MTNDRGWIRGRADVELGVGNSQPTKPLIMSLEQIPTAPNQSLAAGFSVASAPPMRDDARLSTVIKITEEIFGFSPTIETITDPEDPAETTFVVLTVHAQGENKDLIRQHVVWGERVRPVNMDLHFRLSINPSL
jgi:hypothetical protein